MKPLIQHRMLTFILSTYILIASVYSVVVPIFEVSDELWHYPMVHFIANNSFQLPVQNPGNVGPWRQEGSQAPLYYLASALLTAGIDTSDLENVRRINPHADIGIVRPDRNANMIVHRADAETFPWRGTALAVHSVRFFSIALGAATILVTYLLAREIFPDKPIVALGAAALNAYLPMFVFISTSVNNDNLSNLLGGLLTLFVVRLLKTRTLPHWQTYVVIGIVTGAALLSKLNLGFFVPLIGLALLVVSIRLRNWRPLIYGGLISGALTIVIAGWWYWRNFDLYGDPTGMEMFLNVVGRRLVPANAEQLWAERHSFTQAYWGFFGGMNVPMPDANYLIFNVIGGVALLSALAFVGYTLLRRRWTLDQWLPAAVTLLWPLVTFISYLRWTSETPASQGRLIFGALSCISLWMAVGLTWPFPRRLQPITMSATALYFAAVTVIAPFIFIMPTYAPPSPLPTALTAFAFRQDDSANGMIGYVPDPAVLTPAVRPGEYVYAQVDWQIIDPVVRDWSMFVHLTTPEGVIISQRDIYPGGGTLATSDLPATFHWSNPIAIYVPRTAYAPTTLNVNVGWYHLPTGERLRSSLNDLETVTIGQVELLPNESASDVPNPVSVNFDNQIELVGYKLSTLTPTVGQPAELTLYWRGLRAIEPNYTVFAHIIDPATYTITAGSDGQPVAWTRPTSSWQPGEIVEDTHTLNINETAVPGIYELEVGFYLQADDGSFQRLRVVTDDGGMADNYIYLSRVRIVPPRPPEE
ncbi:MAG: glycosyltransferase family 39 protein [Burkholderiales bacterium]|nr:glycosyltransferase family 39 protein [Anaerolineae bacterium]